ncbi:MAG TPA: calcium/sodium antiporter [Planctomycetes bacterium]|nr:calcium/sodium antiporter [Planctomycetota bacterium]HIJ71092.1 calcium/sodium antiporter [Planctomycetota bacterium]
MWQAVLMLGGFVIVIKGASLLVDGASFLAKKLSVSDLVIGPTVVAFGTSLPELSVNVFASIKGNTGIAIGNILGSNIANIFLILGISGLIYPLIVTKGTVWKEIPLSLLAAVVLGVLANDKLIDNAESSVLSRIDGLVLLSFFIIFLCYSFTVAGRIKGSEDLLPAKELTIGKIIALVVLGLAGLILGGNLVVGGAVRLADLLGMSQSTIGLTVVAVGTSLPELATSVVAAYKKNSEIAVGNVIGSNIFNVFFILGVSSVIRPLTFQPRNNFDISVMVLASILLFIFMFTGKKRKLDRWEAALFLVLYAGYIFFVIKS